LRPIAHLPPEVAQLVAEAVRLRPVARLAGGGAAAGELDGLRRCAGARLEQRLEAEHAEHLAQVRVAGARLEPVRGADPLEQRGQRLGGVEVVGEGGEERVAVRGQLGRGLARHQPPSGLADPPCGAHGRLEPLRGERERLAVVAAAEVQDERLGPDLVEHLRQPADVADRLGHLLALGGLEHAVVHPQPRERPPAPRLGLGSLVLVVREREVDPAAVDVELEAQQRLGHRRALDVPAGPARAPGRLPRGVLVGLRALPEREVERVLLAVGTLDALALVHLVHVAVRERAVLGQGAHAEVHVAVRGVGVAALHQRADQVDDLRQELRGERLVVGAAEAEPPGVGDVVRGHLARQLLRAAPRGPRRVVDLVVDVGDVRDERDRVALVLEKALELREDHERPRVAHVHARVDRRAAGVDADAAGVARLERLHLAGARVVERDRPHAGDLSQPR
jgi:hypothetical protein